MQQPEHKLVDSKESLNEIEIIINKFRHTISRCTITLNFLGSINTTTVLEV